ncbi:MAG: hypothetical protein COA58_10600 [Bacteroidetes bacterium]|nr:MAG: hypothetical protein COA58_10600 [Bacteroidota bacterium]
MLYVFGVLSVMGAVLSTNKFTTPENLKIAPDFVGLAALFGAAMLATAIMSFIMASAKDPKIRIMVSSATIVWLVLNVGAHYANVSRGIEGSLLTPIVFSGLLITGFVISMLAERKKLNL